MNKLSAKKKLIGMILLPAFFSGAVMADEVYVEHHDQDNIPGKEGYAIDDRGDVWRNTSTLGNHCWRTSNWTPAMAIEECDPDLIKKPEKVAEAPPPEPVAPPPEKVTFSADALFDFDSAELKPDGIMALDQFVSNLEGVNYDVIVAVGHADRIGSPEYNQKLSVRRAESVKEYLMSKGIEENRIFTDGKGEEQSVTGDTCLGKSGRALKDCFAPDRRVEIEVAGTR